MWNYSSWIRQLFRHCYVKMRWIIKILTFVMSASILCWKIAIFVHTNPTVKWFLVAFCSRGFAKFFEYFFPRLPSVSAFFPVPCRRLWLIRINDTFTVFHAGFPYLGLLLHFLSPLSGSRCGWRLPVEIERMVAGDWSQMPLSTWSGWRVGKFYAQCQQSVTC